MIPALLSSLLADLWPYIMGGLALLFGGWRISRGAKKAARQQIALEAAQHYAKTRKAMDDVEANLSDDPAVLRDFLRSRDPGTR